MSIVRYPRIEPQGPGPWQEWELVSNTKISRSPISGATRTAERGGARWRVTTRYQNLKDPQKSRLKAFLTLCRGMAQRFYLPDWTHDQRGGFTQSQVLTNPDFETTMTPWGTGATGAARSVEQYGRIERLNHFNNVGVSNDGVTVTVGVPYVIRCSIYPGRGLSSIDVRAHAPGDDGTLAFSEQVSTPVRLSLPFVPDEATVDFDLNYLTTAAKDHDVIFLDHYSVSRCALIDVPENLLLRSEEFDNASWTKSDVTVTPNAAEIGNSATADEMIENTAASAHFLWQAYTKTADEEMVTLSVFVKQASGDRDLRMTVRGLSTVHDAECDFDLSAGTAAAVVLQGDFVRGVATITPVTAADDTGWYRCTLSCITDNHTSVESYFSLLSAGSASYTGDGTSGVYLWGAQLQRSALAGVYQETTTAVVDGTSASNPGGELILKGLPANTDGLFLPGDVIDAVYLPDAGGADRSMLVRVSAPVDSDEYGIAAMRVEPGLREAPTITNRYFESSGSEGQRIEPHVMLWRPEMRALLDSESIRWTDKADGSSDLEFVCVEDVVPT